MKCEDVVELLPDDTLGTLTEIEAEGVRRHYRRCGACRRESGALAEGLAMFATAAHQAEPPADLKERVLSVMEEEWTVGRPATSTRFRRRVGLSLAVAALIVAVAGSVAWGISERTTAHRAVVALGDYRWNADAYQRFLQALGGRDVRVASLQPEGTSVVTGSAVLYDSDTGQSWVVVLVRAPGPQQPMVVTLSSSDGRTIRMGEVRFDSRGDGAIWLVTSANLSSFRLLRLTDLDGALQASGTAPPSGSGVSLAP